MLIFINNQNFFLKPTSSNFNFLSYKFYFLGKPAVATAVHSNFAVTSAEVCLGAFDDFKEQWKASVNIEEMQSAYSWYGKTPQEFFTLNKPKNIGGPFGERLGVSTWEKFIPASKKMMVPNSPDYFNADKLFGNISTPENAVAAYKVLAEHSLCVLFFDEVLPIWPACNPLDNGQTVRKMSEIKTNLQEKANQKLGDNYDLEIDEIVMIQKAYEDIASQQFLNAISDFTSYSLENVPKQCFVASYCSKTEKIKEIPVDLLSALACTESFDSAVCKNKIVVTFPDDSPLLKWELTLGAPILCAENGSISARGFLHELIDNTAFFSTGDYKMVEVGKYKLDQKNWKI